MKNKLHGFQEGTTHVTTGDKMKEGDHRRNKYSCKFYNNGKCAYNNNNYKCIGSAHCNYYDDGIPVTQITYHASNEISIETLNNYVNNLKNKIPFNCLEGKYIQYLIRIKHHLKRSEIQQSEKEEADFYYKKTKLENEIDMYNNALKTKCIIASLLIITAPFCYFYYQNNKKTISPNEISNLEKKTINKDLQTKVREYKKEINKYKTEAKTINTISNNTDVKDYLFNNAKSAYQKNDFGNFVFYIKKSIDLHNNKAIIYLSKIYPTGKLGKDKKRLSFILLSYSSYLGHKHSSEIIAKSILSEHPNSNIGYSFLKKSEN